MAENEFRRAVSIDSAPTSSQCEWCDQPAVVRLTAIGDVSHNTSGLFCSECGTTFARTAASDRGSLQHDQ